MGYFSFWLHYTPMGYLCQAKKACPRKGRPAAGRRVPGGHCRRADRDIPPESIQLFSCLMASVRGGMICFLRLRTPGRK